MGSLTKLRLKRHEDRRLRTGHLWVFNNEIDVAATPLKGLEPGELVRLEDHRGEFLAHGYANPASLICVRVLNRDPSQLPDEHLLRGRLRQALEHRQRLYPTDHYRLVFGEGDYLPGLVIDRYGKQLVAQVGTAGMERLWPQVQSALEDLLEPSGILLRNDSASRELEGLAREVRVAAGSVDGLAEILEGGCRFHVPLREGQKTGWFFDQRENRNSFLKYVGGARVLDVFSYVGAWGVRAAAAGAREVLCVDASAQALEYLQENARANAVQCQVLIQDAFEALRDLDKAGERFDVVVLDPPAFIKRRKDHKAGQAAYERINQLGLRLIQSGGILVTCSCSFHLSAEELRHCLVRALRRTGRDGQLLESGGQGPDHPVHPAIGETAYLKSLVCRIAGP